MDYRGNQFKPLINAHVLSTHLQPAHTHTGIHAPERADDLVQVHRSGRRSHLPHCVLLQLVSVAAVPDIRSVPAHAESPVADRRRRQHVVRVASRPETRHTLGGDRRRRLCRLLVSDTGSLGLFFVGVGWRGADSLDWVHRALSGRKPLTLHHMLHRLY